MTTRCPHIPSVLFVSTPSWVCPWFWPLEGACSKVCWVLLVTGFLKLCPIHLQIPFPDGHFTPLLVGTLPKVLVRNHLWPPDSEDVPEPRFLKAWSLEAKIISFFHREIHFDLQTGHRMQKAACAFLYLASTSSSVPPVVVIRLPRYVKAVTCSRILPPQISPMFAGDRILVPLVLDTFTLSPILTACSWSASSFCLICETL